MATRRRFYRLRRVAVAEIAAFAAAERLVLSVADDGLRLEGLAAPIGWIFADCREVEDAGGLIYLWPRQGAPAIAPTRVFADVTEAARLLRYIRSRLPRGLARSASDP